jgi:hypothetical protein
MHQCSRRECPPARVYLVGVKFWSRCLWACRRWFDVGLLALIEPETAEADDKRPCHDINPARTVGVQMRPALHAEKQLFKRLEVRTTRH